MSESRADLAAIADELRALHAAPELLVMPNAWDAASARLIAGELGYAAIATTSSGVAETLGFADGQVTPPAEMFAAVGRIAAAVEVPVTADLEAGYWLSAPELVGALLDAGAVGMNIEDTDPRSGRIVPLEQQAARLAAIKAAGRDAGVDVVLNARIDEFIHGDRSLEAGLERAAAYIAAGADSIYPIGLADEAMISAFVELGAVNVLMRKGAPSLARLQELGVARVTWGGGVFHAAIGSVREFLRA
jgi:2-methylisocitrate lyase-like PEP mutase family enzyme